MKGQVIKVIHTILGELGYVSYEFLMSIGLNSEKYPFSKIECVRYAGGVVLSVRFKEGNGYTRVKADMPELVEAELRANNA